MATSKSKAPQIGTAHWILNEREQARTFIEQETEEFSYAAKNDLEWLNEHMAEIFSRNQLHVADVFKTPGKLRGKTPRTARKRAPLESRAPLTDIFAPNTRNTKSPARATGFYKNVTKLQDENAPAQSEAGTLPSGQTQGPAPGKENVDSGYHGLPEDEMDMDRTLKAMPSQDSNPKLPTSSSPQHHSTPQWQQDENAEERRTTVGSFVSAKEAFGSKAVDEPPSQSAADEGDSAQDTVIITRMPEGTEKPDGNVEHNIQASANMQTLEQVEDQMEVDEPQSPSETSSPEKPLLRKSSLTFASLPAREPLAKMSVGNRTSYLEQHRTTGVRPSSQIGNWNGARSVGDGQNAQANNHAETADNMDIGENDNPSRINQNSESPKKHSESATQRLHERITMLGQSKEPRPSKSIPSMAAASQTVSSQAAKPETGADQNTTSANAENGGVHIEEDDDDDWIAPIDSHKHTKPQQWPQLAKSSFSKTSILLSQSQKPRRPPAKDSAPKTQPAPVSIRLPSQSKKVGQAPSTNASQPSLQDSFSSSQSKQSGPVTKASNSSLQSSTSANTLKSSTSGPTKPSSLQAAARKKELEEKAAQRKAEQKREIERKRAAKQEEERKQEEQRKAAEQQRMQETREAAQRKAMEQRRLDQQRLEQQRAKMLAKQKQATDLAAKLQQEKAQAHPAPSRADLGAARPMSRMNTIQDQMRPIPHPPINPAKPPKRAKPEEEDDEQTSRPAVQRAGSSYQQTEAKRRKTDERDGEEDSEQRHSVKAPPIRNSNIRKDQQKFPHGYTNAPAPASHPPSMFRTTVTAQHQMQQSKASGHPNEMAKFSSAKIPFAEVPNPPAGPSYANSQNYKTPARGSQTQNVMGSTTTTTKVPLKPSPQYTPGENIALPDINTDSEDSDASTSPDFRPPSWANSPALRELLTQQQLVDPEQIFGPVAPLQMEEVFKNKDRHKRFRDRTSSANWSGQDRLTEEDKRKDREGRERVAREGGWTFTGPR